MTTTTLRASCENPALREIHRSKISQHRAKAGYSYLTIRFMLFFSCRVALPAPSSSFSVSAFGPSSGCVSPFRDSHNKHLAREALLIDHLYPRFFARCFWSSSRFLCCSVNQKLLLFVRTKIPCERRGKYPFAVESRLYWDDNTAKNSYIKVLFSFYNSRYHKRSYV
jgi:hypothetical protein